MGASITSKTRQQPGIVTLGLGDLKTNVADRMQKWCSFSAQRFLRNNNGNKAQKVKICYLDQACNWSLQGCQYFPCGCKTLIHDDFQATFPGPLPEVCGKPFIMKHVSVTKCVEVQHVSPDHSAYLLWLLHWVI